MLGNEIYMHTFLEWRIGLSLLQILTLLHTLLRLTSHVTHVYNLTIFMNPMRSTNFAYARD